MSNYLRRIIDEPTPQNEPLDDRMKPNTAGGWSYPVTDQVRAHRFLIAGAEDGSYYQSERKLVRENAAAMGRYLARAGVEAVAHMVDVTVNRRAPRVSPALFSLAMAASSEDDATRKAALTALPEVAATASFLQEFVNYATAMRGWGRGMRRAVSNWYTSRPPDRVAFQAVKYRARSNWSHRNLLRTAHPQAVKESELWHIFEWITHGDHAAGNQRHPHHPRLRTGQDGNRPGQAGGTDHRRAAPTGSRTPRTCSGTAKSGLP